MGDFSHLREIHSIQFLSEKIILKLNQPNFSNHSEKELKSPSLWGGFRWGYGY
jgi:hypothetical protein